MCACLFAQCCLRAILQWLLKRVQTLHEGIFRVLWPLFHYLPAEVEFKEEQWSAYEKANMMFLEELSKLGVHNSLVWVHDYHLMLLPAMLRKSIKVENVKIGFFLHTP